MPDGTSRRLDLPMQTRNAAVSTVDAAARTVELVWTTGARVIRSDFWSGERYGEELSLDAGAVDLTRLNNGAPLLNSHGQYSLTDVIGVVERAWIANGEGRAVVRFSARDDVESIWRDVQAGIIRNVSVGYTVRKFEVDRSGELPIYRAVDWQPMEISLVPVPADAGAGTRAASHAATSCEIINRATPTTQESAMDEQNEQAGAEPVNDAAAGTETATTTETRSAPAGVDAAAIVAGERARVSEIGAIAARHGLPADLVQRHVDAGTPVDTFRGVALDALAARSEATVINNRHNAQTVDNPAVRSVALTDALAARITGRSAEGPAQAFAGLGFVDLARELTGDRRSAPSEVVARAMAQSADFPVILANAGNKVLLDTYNAALPTYRSFAKRRDFNNFQAHSVAGLGDFPALQGKTETGDYAEGTVGEKGETLAASEYGAIYHVSRKMLINDDLGAFADMAARAALQAAHKENNVVYGVLAANPAMSDTHALFSVEHGNLDSTGDAIDVGPIAAARAAMRKQVSVDGMKLNINGRFLVVGPDSELEARRVVAAITPANVASVNPFSGTLEVVVDASIEGNEWYVFADPALAPVLVYGYVNGGAAPTFATYRRFESDSLKMRVQLDFGAGVVDFRGAYKNVGA